MGKLLAFPRVQRPAGNPARGCVHCWAREGGGYEIGHESQSGNSWGSFFQFERAEDAIKAAYNLARESYGNAIVWIDPVVLAAVPFTAGPARGSW